MTGVAAPIVDWRKIRARVCDGKVSYGCETARTIAARHRATGERISAYRCPFCHRWHCGHTASIESLRTIAAAIRARHDDPSADEAGDDG